jgi:hypothetical protein
VRNTVATHIHASIAVLSTSNCGSKAVSVFSFGPVTELGLGLGYVDVVFVEVTRFLSCA